MYIWGEIMFWNVIDKQRYQILKQVCQTISIKNYYMAGGTALAIQTGLRESFDFDFFVQEQFDIQQLVQELEVIGELQVTSYREGTLHCILENVQLTFLYFPNKLLEKLVKIEEIPNLYLASIKDIALMKLIAISQRGTKKDFFDLFYICNKLNMTIKDFLDLLKSKYDQNKINFSHIIKSLSYFEDAEDEILPKTFIQYDWEKIKEYYKEEQIRIYKE